VLRRARNLPVGAQRNDLRQLAIGLLWLDKHRKHCAIAKMAYRRTPPPARNDDRDASLPGSFDRRK
jgi:hypothetical protein